jgi:phosphohistidine swiveling domain-containing protein
MNATPQAASLDANHDVVEWSTPQEAALFWTADLMHWPNGISPLAATMDIPAWDRGFKKAAEALSMPFSQDSGFKVIRGHVYTGFAPYSTDPATMGARIGGMQARMQRHIPGLLRRWHTEYEPEVRAINDETICRDYRGLTDEALADALEQVVAGRERQGELHYLTVFPAGTAVIAFEQVYVSLFGAPQAGEHLGLLQGFPNKALEVDAGLWRLAAEARKDPRVLALLRTAELHEVDAALGQDPETAWFRTLVVEYLERYGWRGGEHDVASVTWREDPAPAYGFIREYAERPDYDPDDDLRSLAAAREARERSLLERLDASQAKQFRQVLAGAQQYLPAEEDHNFWIDQQGIAVHRLPVLEAADRLVRAGRIVTRDDVFYLEFDELVVALRGRPDDLHELVASRKWAQQQNSLHAPPVTLGTPPPPDMPEDPFMVNFFGGRMMPTPDPRMVRGNAASAGTVTGTARIIRSLDEAWKLEAGEIIVCPVTMPSWTPLFALAAAVVTDHGGALSHTAIVAREYGLPAVVGTKVGTQVIRDGQTVTVDGRSGTVRLESA